MPIPVVLITGLVELAKLGLQMYFQAMRQAGKSPEEIDMMYNEERDYFEAHPPQTLPEVGGPDA